MHPRYIVLEKRPSERWRPIQGFHYDISSHGRVFSALSGSALTPTPDHFGHLYVKLCSKHGRKRMAVHRLVLTAFVGPCPEGMEACHGPGGPADNRLANLRWDTRSANHVDMHDDAAARDECVHPKARLTPAQVREIVARLASGSTTAALGREYGVSQAAIVDIRVGRTWRRVTSPAASPAASRPR
jgi:hypothetical protein